MAVLIVDDSEFVRKAYASSLSALGFDVDVARDGGEGLACLSQRAYDAVVSDLEMPGMSGIEFLRAVRATDPDIPVILLTGTPTLDSAADAVEYRAYRYLTKSARVDVLADTIRRAERYHALGRLKRQAMAANGTGQRAAEAAALEGRFESALGHLWIAFQPIVCWPDRRVHGYEVLMRSGEGTLCKPDQILSAAERLGRLLELGRGIRAQTAAAMSWLPPDATVFVNLHPIDLNDPELYQEGPLTRMAPRVVLEITERASLESVPSLSQRLLELRSLGFRLAVDDLGAGYAGLTSMTHIEPEYVKLDMSLVRGIDGTPTKQKVVRSMAHLCDDLGMRVVAEGIETAAERDALGASGCGLLQGYFFARPGSRPPAVNWG
jgi:EAL domain-containing protein (putative c-di-GMP-specific phosphodiesterase class I)